MIEGDIYIFSFKPWMFKFIIDAAIGYWNSWLCLGCMHFVFVIYSRSYKCLVVGHPNCCQNVWHVNVNLLSFLFPI